MAIVLGLIIIAGVVQSEVLGYMVAAVLAFWGIATAAGKIIEADEARKSGAD